MSTTHSTRDGDDRYTIVGTRQRERTGSGPAVLLLNRSSRLLRKELFAQLVRQGYREIVSVEPQEHSYTVEALTREFPQVRFLLLTRPINIGAQINLGMKHIAQEHVLVHWSTMEPPQGVERAATYLRSGQAVCVAPMLRGERGEALPVLQAPAMQRRALRVLSLPLRGERGPTLFPFDFVGLYDRSRFLRSEGFDELIENPFWQKLDFGFRIHLWGGVIEALSAFRVTYRSMPDPEDQTGDQGYARFFAKNLAVRTTENGAQLPVWQAVAFALRSRLGVSRTIMVFRAARRWLERHERRYVRDARSVVEEWRVEHV